jgi:hypothetical protein
LQKNRWRERVCLAALFVIQHIDRERGRGSEREKSDTCTSLKGIKTFKNTDWVICERYLNRRGEGPNLSLL